MTTILYLDIETAAADPGTFDPGEIKAPATYKDPEKIAAYIEEAIKEAHGKTSFDVHRGRLLCVGLAVGNDAPTVAYDATLTETPRILSAVHAACLDASKRGNGRFSICGHNVAGFDIKWLWRLAIKHRHPLANILPYRKWGDGLIDTMAMWSQTDPRDMVKLDTIARFLGLEGKEPGMNGAEVWPAYLRGEHDRIAAYCAKDVALTRAIHLRMIGEDPLPF